MKRIIDHHLLAWKESDGRKPLLLRGARQVGKTHSVRTLGAHFKQFVEINLEANAAACAIIAKDFDVIRIVRQLSELMNIDITAGDTLLFFDEIQKLPQAITTLRYFYEHLPNLHVIAAGSLLDFAIEQVGIPVGRVTQLYVSPLSFLEFLVALGHNYWGKLILELSATTPLAEPVHEKLLELVGHYLAIGGMPEAVVQWRKSQTSRMVKAVHADLLATYQQDFDRYSKRHQLKYLQLLFAQAMLQLGKKFMYTRVGQYQKRELQPALELLEKAGLFHRALRTAGQGVPLGAQASLDDFKLLFLDVGLSQALLKFDISSWLIDHTQTFINKGEIVESFVGQELIAYADPIMKEQLFYWRREQQASQAEIDYLVQLGNNIIPIEVKAGTSQHVKSLQIFLESHPSSPYGIRFSALPIAAAPTIHSYPLYAIARPFIDASPALHEALNFLVKS